MLQTKHFKMAETNKKIKEPHRRRNPNRINRYILFCFVDQPWQLRQRVEPTAMIKK